jgi:hypothetical protein
MKNIISKTIAGLSLAVCLTGTSCIGPNNAFNSLSNWNSGLSESKYINELAFIGLNIIPAYPICLWGDYIIFNSVEFWTGENLIKKPEPFTPQETK